MISNVKVNPGVCGFETTVRAEGMDMKTVRIQFSTQCPNLKALEQELTEVDAFKEVFAKFGESNICALGQKYCKHAACPVPTAIIKGVEVAAGLALPKDVEFQIAKE